MKIRKTALSFLCASAVLLSSGLSFAYNDISGHWAEDYINEMDQMNVLGQFEDESLQPDRPLNRAECAELISDFFQNNPKFAFNQTLNPEDTKFPDLTYGTRNTMKINDLAWYTYESLITSELYNGNPYALRNTKIINGYPDGTFQPYNNVTRAEFAKMFINALDCFGYLNPGYIETYGDHYYHWGYKYLSIAVTYGIMNGYGSIYQYVPEASYYTDYMILKPDDNITRAEAIKMLSTAKDFEYTTDTRRSGPFFTYFKSWGDSLNWSSPDEAVDLYEKVFKQDRYKDKVIWENYDRSCWSLYPEYTYDNVMTLHWKNIGGAGGSYYQFINYGKYADIMIYDGNASFPAHVPYTITVDTDTLDIIGEGSYSR